ncbi:MAG: hypothetical protein ACLP0J_28210 [Solirubrobacteraceae bacterium]
MSNLILPAPVERHQDTLQRVSKQQRIDDFISVAKSFLGPGAGTMGAGRGAVGGGAPGSPMKTSWSSNLGNAALLQRATQTYSQQYNVPAAEIEQALADQGLSWSAPFAPGRPLSPVAGYREPPRTRDFQVGENVQVTPPRGQDQLRDAEGAVRRVGRPAALLPAPDQRRPQP